ncbi:peptidoglycan D,D-transpeptidase FtsI family protein [Thermoflexus sp.]|uniref:peptidoglycan D,D-transpeptidase FtsI family protein n=1 Tax=Thermoflexus sp. TaxID=1969742 RepID=UPI0025F4ED58|nr:penicillin-binding protein 2 [Thermoflexus sp.]MCS7349923.1 penicillin-binding protein 2 [Thermoflexus sp.]MCX7689679.1 penicillin-binding protein 2 [Thermoflexus sp.]MDW8179370.1 penicillin-binding protein 2 [Anaerolineae bacterium]
MKEPASMLRLHPVAFPPAMLLGLVVIRLIYLTFYVPGEPSGVQSLELRLEAQRGRILDRREAVLAMDAPRYQVVLEYPPLVQGGDPVRRAKWLQQVDEILSPMLGLSAQEAARNWPDTWWQFPIARGIPEDLARAVSRRVEETGLRGVRVLPYWKRVYPEGSLLGPVVGFVFFGADHQGLEGRQGAAGVEKAYDEFLRGKPVILRVPVDAEGRPLPVKEEALAQPEPGGEVVLTIDRTIQAIVAEELARGLQESGAQRGDVVVLRPRTGEILAMVSLPAFDPNSPETLDRDARNPVVQDLYEPGSVFKILTMAAALEAGVVQPETRYLDYGCVEFGGAPICNWDRDRYPGGRGWLDMTELLIYSRNVGAAYLARMLGPDRFYAALHAFGIGEPTDVDLPYEATMRVRAYGDPNWREADLGRQAFGQAVSVTPLQMAVAVSAVAHDGLIMRPFVVREVRTAEGVWRTEPRIRRRAISVQTARTLREMLAAVIEREAVKARVPGYRMAGKTGTAQIPTPLGYDPRETIASFVGFGPVEDPQVLILVKLDRPRRSPWGSEEAAPVFARIAARILPLLGVPPSASGP